MHWPMHTRHIGVESIDVVSSSVNSADSNAAIMALVYIQDFMLE